MKLMTHRYHHHWYSSEKNYLTVWHHTCILWPHNLIMYTIIINIRWGTLTLLMSRKKFNVHSKQIYLAGTNHCNAKCTREHKKFFRTRRVAPKMVTQAEKLAFGVHWCAFQPLKLGHLTNYILFIAIATCTFMLHCYSYIHVESVWSM